MDYSSLIKNSQHFFQCKCVGDDKVAHPFFSTYNMFTPTELQELQVITSAARLSSYSRLLGTTTASEAYGAYMWSMAVSTAFSPVVHALEVGFRNSLNTAMSPHYGNDWFEIWVVKDANAHRAAGKPASWKSTGEKLIEEAKDKIKKRDHPNGVPAGYKISWQRVLAEMSFGFWVFFLVKRFWDVNNKTKLWPNHLISAFPGSPTSSHAVGAMYKAFSEIVDLRNRIHHQEPIWKHHTVNCCSDALKYLNDTLDSALNKLDYLGRGQRSALEKYGVIAAIRELCTQSAFDRFAGRSQGTTKRYNQVKKNVGLIGKRTKDSNCIWVLSNAGDDVKLIIRNGNRRFF